MHVNTVYDLASCQGVVFRICFPDGLDLCLNWWSSWRKASKPFGPVSRTFSRLPSTPSPNPHPPLVVRPHFSLSHICTNTLPEHRDTIERDLWAQFVCFNGQKEAPDLTAGRPCGLWTHEEITVKSHQGFNSLWPSYGFPLAFRGVLVCG